MLCEVLCKHAIADKSVQGSETSNDSAQSSSTMLAVEKDDRARKTISGSDKGIFPTEGENTQIGPEFPSKLDWLNTAQLQFCRDLDDFVEAALMFYEKHNLLDNTPITLNLEKDNDPRLSASPLKFPGKLAIDILNNRLFISDSNHNHIVGALSLSLSLPPSLPPSLFKLQIKPQIPKCIKVITDLDGNFIVQIGSNWEQGLQDGSFDDATFNKSVTVLEI
ncbi:uncharacterized protein DS421_16g535770 [Arachis hypogaea]|nr:uncharacterized protein DS421_16g535770 [Arachis hypogaea]